MVGVVYGQAKLLVRRSNSYDWCKRVIEVNW